MRFNAPDIIMNIPDIKQIYDINDKQSNDLDSDIELLSDDMFLSTMHIEMVEMYEGIMGINPLDTDTLEERRVRVNSQLLDNTPYTEEEIKQKLYALSGTDFEINIDIKRKICDIKVALTSKKMAGFVEDMLDNMIPMDMSLNVELKYNTYNLLKTKTHDELSTVTYQSLREDVI